MLTSPPRHRARGAPVGRARPLHSSVVNGGRRRPPLAALTDVDGRPPSYSLTIRASPRGEAAVVRNAANRPRRNRVLPAFRRKMTASDARALGDSVARRKYLATKPAVKCAASALRAARVRGAPEARVPAYGALTLGDKECHSNLATKVPCIDGSRRDRHIGTRQKISRPT